MLPSEAARRRFILTALRRGPSQAEAILASAPRLEQQLDIACLRLDVERIREHLARQATCSAHLADSADATAADGSSASDSASEAARPPAMQGEGATSTSPSTLHSATAPLMYAVLSPYGDDSGEGRQRRLSCVRLLLESGHASDVAVRETDLPGRRFTALACAVQKDDRGLVGTLLQAGAPIRDGAAMFLAASRGHWETAALLRAEGADWDQTDPDGRHTPLHWLLDWHNEPESIRRLLDEGADPNVPSGAQRESALHAAVRRRRKEWIEPLARAGAQLDAVTAGGMTAYRHARRRTFGEVADELERLGADTRLTVGDRLALALDGQDFDAATSLEPQLEQPIPDWPAEEARLLSDLASRGRVEAVDWLLDRGADIAARGLDDGTPLHLTAWFGEADAADRLIERGAPLDLRGDAHDSTPLGWVAHGSRYSGGARERGAVYARIARALLQAGAPLPDPEALHDHAQLAQASHPVATVLREFGWQGPESDPFGDAASG